MLSLALIVGVSGPGFCLAAGESVTLTAQGRAQLPILIKHQPAGATAIRTELTPYGQRTPVEVPTGQAIEAVAQDLAGMLARITGSTFDIRHTRQAADGIVLGLSSDFPELNLQGRFNPQDPFRTEEYLLQSHENRLYIIGASVTALEHAVADLLHETGYRLYFPGDNWEIVPHKPTLQLAVDRFESPSYHSRLIWYGSGMQPYNTPYYERWTRRNRIAAGFSLNTSHEYNAIRARHKQAFQDNPQFYAQIDGEHKVSAHAKLNVADPGLQKLVIDDARQWFQDHPHQISKSMDPSDFGGWSNTGPSAELGEGTNQALTLANLVAKAVNDDPAKERFIGIYAYYQHQLPPTIPVDEHIITSFATRFLRPGMVVDQLIEGWKAQGLKQFGIREYYGVYIWDNDLPAFPIHGADLAYLKQTIPHFHHEGARFLTAESSDAWGVLGLGHYVASRLLWDVNEAAQVDQIVDEFLENAFGPAQEPMRDFYRLINGEDRVLLQDNMTGRMYTLLAQARRLASGDEAVMRRLDDLVLFTRYVELMQDYLALRTAQQPRQEAFEAVMKHAYRMHRSMMVHVTAMYARNMLKRFDKQVTMPAEAQWSVPTDKNPWKNDTPFSREEVDAFVAQGQVRHRESSLASFTWQRASGDGAGRAGKSNGVRARDGVVYLVHADQAGEVALGLSAAPVGMAWGPAWRVVRTSDGKAIAQGRLPLSQDETVTFNAPTAGMYALFIEPTLNTTRITSEHPVAIWAESPTMGSGYQHFYRPKARFYFHVPAGVAQTYVKIAGQGKGEYVQGVLYDDQGREVERVGKINGNEPHAFAINRSANAPGQVWSVEILPPADGYFEDGYIMLPAEIPSVLWLDPEDVFTTRPE